MHKKLQTYRLSNINDNKKLCNENTKDFILSYPSLKSQFLEFRVGDMDTLLLMDT